jgi:hypothetical protein
MEAAMTRSEFNMFKPYSRKCLYSTISLIAALLLNSVSLLFIESGSVKIAIGAVSIALAAVFFLIRLAETRKKGRLIVDDRKLLYESEELPAEEIDRMTLSYGILTIQRKRDKSRWTALHLRTVKPEDADPLKDRIAAFASAHNIKFEMVK